MSPDELIEKALYAYDTTAGPPYSSTAGMRAALETVAADIWDEGYEDAARYHDLDTEHSAPNPYRASETA
jgi:hypothetical protein